MLVQHSQSNVLTNRLWRKQKGSSLLEILISILLLSFGMLALAGMQAYAVSAQKNAANRAIAAALANELAEVIRLNPGSRIAPFTGFANGAYDISLMTNASPPDLDATQCDFPTCNTPALLAVADMGSFQNRVRQQLPQGGVVLSRPVTAGVTSQTEADLWILWEEGQSLLNTRTVGGALQSAEMNVDNCPAAARALATLPRCFYMKVAL